MQHVHDAWRQGVEATLYAALMSVANASYNTGELLGALVTQLLGITAPCFTNMPWLILSARSAACCRCPSCASSAAPMRLCRPRSLLTFSGVTFGAHIVHLC